MLNGFHNITSTDSDLYTVNWNSVYIPPYTPYRSLHSTRQLPGSNVLPCITTALGPQSPLHTNQQPRTQVVHTRLCSTTQQPASDRDRPRHQMRLPEAEMELTNGQGIASWHSTPATARLALPAGASTSTGGTYHYSPCRARASLMPSHLKSHNLVPNVEWQPALSGWLAVTPGVSLTAGAQQIAQQRAERRQNMRHRDAQGTCSCACS
jgi:hypothetical protein